VQVPVATGRKGGDVDSFFGLGSTLTPVIVFAFIFFLMGTRIVRPTHRGLVERLGRYKRFAEPGFHWIIPLIDRMFKVNITEQMLNAEPQEIITNDNLNAKVDAQVYFHDNLNAKVDAQVYFRIRQDEESVKASLYNVNDYRYQIVNLARTTLRNIIGTMSLKSANSERGRINDGLLGTLAQETRVWGLEIVRTELKEIDPPADVQETMNKVVKAENEKIAAVDFATAAETQADGAKRSKIKEAEGVKAAKVLQAEGEAEAIRLVNEAAQRYFVGNAQVLRRLESVEKALEKNAKVVLPSNGQLVNVISELAGIAPLPAGPESAASQAELSVGKDPDSGA
jgi:regulator of protease activity HflC (stomatin/prohibitin superfamily)